jgi:hypothetical protein
MDSASPPLPVPTSDGLRAALIELVSGMQAMVSEKAFPRLMAAFIDAGEQEPTPPWSVSPVVVASCVLAPSQSLSHAGSVRNSIRAQSSSSRPV